MVKRLGRAGSENGEEFDVALIERTPHHLRGDGRSAGRHMDHRQAVLSLHARNVIVNL